MSKSPIKETANTLLQRIIENGLRDKMEEWTYEFLSTLILTYSVYKEEVENSKLVLSLNQLFEVFVLYAVGVCISFCVFCIELWKRNRHT